MDVDADAVDDVETATDHAVAVGDRRRDTGRVVVATDGLGSRPGDRTDWDRALTAYAEIRTARTALVQRTARRWGDFWHCDGLFRATRNALLRDRDPGDFRYIDWLYAG